MSRIVRRPRRLLLENLESRAMLAGNVTASVTDGVLRIVGDDRANGVNIKQLAPSDPTTPWPGVRLEVTGVPAVRGSDQQTTVNGGSSVIVEGVKKGVGISLGGGGDRLKVVNPLPGMNGAPNRAQVNLPGVVYIGMGSHGGAMTLYVINHTKVTIGLGNDSSGLTMWGSQVHDLTVNGSTQSDRISLNGLVSRGTVSLNGGPAGVNEGGNDQIEVLNKYTDIRGALSIVTNPSSDIALGSPDRQLPASTSEWARISGPVTIDARGSRGDSIYVVGVKSMSSLSIGTGAGNDGIFVSGLDGNALELDGGDGDGDRLTSFIPSRVSFASILIVGIESNQTDISST